MEAKRGTIVKIEIRDIYVVYFPFAISILYIYESRTLEIYICGKFDFYEIFFLKCYIEYLTHYTRYRLLHSD